MHINTQVIRGEGSASGTSDESTGTIAAQKPFFKEAGVARIESCFNGTINLDISPSTFKILRPDYSVTSEWEPGTHETFWLVDMTIEHRGMHYPAYIYYPLPSPVKAHPDSTIEILSEKIDMLEYGDDVVLIIPDDSVEILHG